MSDSPSAPVLTLDRARAIGIRKDQVYRMAETGELERVGRGVYVRPDQIDPEFTPLAAASALRPTATMCLTSALSFYELTDMVPFGTDIALPRGVRHPAGFAHVVWHSFDVATFDVGRTQLEVGAGVSVALYSAERTIVDTFRMAHQEGMDVAHTALRRWVNRRGNSPSSLLAVASSFPMAMPRIRHALEVLL